MPQNTLIDRIGVEYNIAKNWLNALSNHSQDGNEYSEESDGTLLVRMFAYSSFVEERLSEKIYELFMPSVFITIYKLLDEVLIYTYEEVMGTSLNPRMGYEIKSKLFQGINQKYKGILYPGLIVSNAVSISPLGIMSNETWLKRITFLHAKLRSKRNALIHDSNFEIKHDHILFKAVPIDEKLDYGDIYRLLQVTLYAVDQIVHPVSSRRVHRMEYYYQNLTFHESICENIFYHPRLLDTLVLKLEKKENSYFTNFNSLEKRASESRFGRKTDYISFVIDDDKWLIPRSDIIEKQLKLDEIIDLKMFDEYRNKPYSYFEELRNL